MFGQGMSGSAAGWMEDAFKDARQDLWNERAYYQRGVDRQNAVEDAKLAYQRNLDAYGSRYQMTMADMRAAGLNPLLAVSQGVGGVAPAQPAQQTGASFPHVQGSKGSSAGVAAFYQGASAQQALANAELTQSTAALQRAQTDNVRADTLTKIEQPELVRAQVVQARQSVAQSIAEIDRIRATTGRENASAAQLVQSVKNLQAEIPRIEATVRHLDAVAAQARAGTREIDQRVAENLPQIERKLKELHAVLEKLKQPEAMNQAGMHSTYLGALSTLLKGLSPLIR